MTAIGLDLKTVPQIIGSEVESDRGISAAVFGWRRQE